MIDRAAGRSVALLGSGEFGAWHDDVDAWLLARANGDGSILILPTAAAPEGDDVFDRWGRMGLEHYARLGIAAEVLPVKRRDDAMDDGPVARVREASAVFFSGGNPWYLATVLSETPLWAAIQERLTDGLAYAGCSAGVACLTSTTYDSDTDDLGAVWQPGLGYTRSGVLFAPHWDIVDSWIPGARAFIESATPPGGVLVALDEDTAMAGDGTSWEVHGRQAIHVLADGTWVSHGAGSTFELPLFP
ncbi:MAG TPA: Type 1 glutamine amidotransferase-like domain-containing protein [Actinomycetota bacterium]